MNMNQRRLHGTIADGPMQMPILQEQNMAVRRPAAPLSLMDRIAVWLSSPPAEVRGIEPTKVSTYTKGACRGHNFIQPPAPLLHFSSPQAAQQRERINRVVEQVKFLRSHSGTTQFDDNDDDDDPIPIRAGPFSFPNAYGRVSARLIGLNGEYLPAGEDLYGDDDEIRPPVQLSYFAGQQTAGQPQYPTSRVTAEVNLLRSRFGRV